MNSPKEQHYINSLEPETPCEKCNGDMYYEVPNYRLEIMERIECMDCLIQEQYKDHLKDELTRIMASVSQQKLAQIVAELFTKVQN